MQKQMVIFFILLILSTWAVAQPVVLGEYKGEGINKIHMINSDGETSTETSCQFSFNVYPSLSQVDYVYAHFNCGGKEWNDHPLRMKSVGQDLFETRSDGSLGKKVGHRLAEGGFIIEFTRKTKKTIWERVPRPLVTGQPCYVDEKFREIDLEDSFYISFQLISENKFRIERKFHREGFEQKKRSDLCPQEFSYIKVQADVNFHGEASK